MFRLFCHSSLMQEDKKNLPEYFDKLTEQDKLNYKVLQQHFTKDRFQRSNRRQADLVTRSLDLIDAFVQNDSARSLVCGYYRYSDKLLINIRQLKVLLCCCKSQCNIMLKNAGYKAVLDRPKIAELRILFNVELSDTFARCWSYRASPYWPYQIYKQVVLDQYDTNPVRDVELHFPEQDELTSPSPCCEEYEYEQYDPATNLCAIDLL